MDSHERIMMVDGDPLGESFDSVQGPFGYVL